VEGTNARPAGFSTESWEGVKIIAAAVAVNSTPVPSGHRWPESPVEGSFRAVMSSNLNPGLTAM
jgi:hypothetical protein